MSGTYTSESSGDWGTATIWSTGSVPNSSTAHVTIDTDVTIASGESFTAGPLAVAGARLLDVAGSLTVAGGATVKGGVVMDGGVLRTGGLHLATQSSALGGSGTVVGSIGNFGLVYAANGLLDLAGSLEVFVRDMMPCWETPGLAATCAA